VEAGEINPDVVVTPGVYVDRVVKIPEGDVGSEKQKKELIEIILETEGLRRLMFKKGS
jgi:hypothetical protein